MNKRNISPLRNRETLLGSILLIASIMFLIGVAGFADSASRYRAIAPSFFPNLLGTALAVLSVLLMVEGIRTEPSKIFKIETTRKNILQAGSVLGTLIVFVILFRVLGFAIMAFIFTAGLQIILGEKRILRVIFTSAAVTAVLYIVFVMLLRVPFPVGIFFE